jgi:TonB family protein
MTVQNQNQQNQSHARARPNIALACVVSLALHGAFYGLAGQFSEAPLAKTQPLTVIALAPADKKPPSAKPPRKVAPPQPSKITTPRRVKTNRARSQKQAPRREWASGTAPRIAHTTVAPRVRISPRATQRRDMEVTTTSGQSEFRLPAGGRAAKGRRLPSFAPFESASSGTNDTTNVPQLPGASGRSRAVGPETGLETGAPGNFGNGSERRMAMNFSGASGASRRGEDGEEAGSSEGPEREISPLAGTARPARRARRSDDLEAPTPLPTATPRPTPTPKPTLRPTTRENEVKPQSLEPQKPPREEPFQRAQILSSPKPSYPSEARERNLEGTVQLRLEISAGGEITGVSIAKSSGVPALDEASLRAVRRWKLSPARRGDTPVASTRLVNLVWSLKE